MRVRKHFSVTLACAMLYSTFVLAQPAMIDGGSKDFSADDLVCRVDIFNPDQIADFAAASSATIYHSDRVLDADEYEELCDALTANPALTRLRNAIKADPEVSQWFADNGISPDSVILLVDNGNGKFDVYLQ
jgi:hypothetical protein